jgi:hypothetical protein
MRRFLKIVGWVIGVALVALIALFVGLRHSATPTTPGPEAEALAQEMVRAVDGEAWNRTGAVRWKLQWRRHLWDRQRGLARVEWSDKRVLFDTGAKHGRAWKKDVEVTDADERQKLIEQAWKWWINDSFWLNPVVKAFDAGTSRARGMVGGKRALLVSYASGGVTPGDRYLWILGDDGRPVAWRLWVKVVPIPGVQFSWEGWTRLPTGAWVATSHKQLGIDLLKIQELTAGATLHDIEPSDPFAPIL